MWFIRDNETKKEAWVHYSKNLSINSNEYTNIQFIKEKPVYGKDVEIVDYTVQHDKLDIIGDKIKILIEYALHHGSISFYGEEDILDSIFLHKEERKSWIEKYKKLEKAYETLNLEDTFKRYAHDLFVDYVDDNKYNFYFAIMHDADFNCYSYNKELVKNWLDETISDLTMTIDEESDVVYTINDFDTNVD